jgi:hypothetical protein
MRNFDRQQRIVITTKPIERQDEEPCKNSSLNRGVAVWLIVNHHGLRIGDAVICGRQSACRSRHHNDCAGGNAVSHQLVLHHRGVTNGADNADEAGGPVPASFAAIWMVSLATLVK